jgi:hypothetical protein
MFIPRFAQGRPCANPEHTCHGRNGSVDECTLEYFIIAADASESRSPGAIIPALPGLVPSIVWPSALVELLLFNG